MSELTLFETPEGCIAIKGDNRVEIAADRDRRDPLVFLRLIRSGPDKSRPPFVTFIHLDPAMAKAVAQRLYELAREIEADLR